MLREILLADLSFSFIRHPLVVKIYQSNNWFLSVHARYTMLRIVYVNGSRAIISIIFVFNLPSSLSLPLRRQLADLRDVRIAFISDSARLRWIYMRPPSRLFSRYKRVSWRLSIIYFDHRASCNRNRSRRNIPRCCSIRWTYTIQRTGLQ